MAIPDSITKLRILLVDDDNFIRRTTAHILSNLNVNEVLEAGNGVEAISVLNQHDVDLLITDIQMPEMNGIELIKQIRIGNTSSKRDLRVIAFTSFSNTEVLGSCLALDINGFLVKPITLDSANEKIVIAMGEQVNLRQQVAYQQVKTDIKSLAQTAVTQESSVSAPVLIEQNQPEEPDSRKPTDKFVSLNQLEPGMQLLDDLHTNSGIKLISAGQVLNESLVNRVAELARVIGTREVGIK